MLTSWQINYYWRRARAFSLNSALLNVMHRLIKNAFQNRCSGTLSYNYILREIFIFHPKQYDSSLYFRWPSHKNGWSTI